MMGVLNGYNSEFLTSLLSVLHWQSHGQHNCRVTRKSRVAHKNSLCFSLLLNDPVELQNLMKPIKEP